MFRYLIHGYEKMDNRGECKNVAFVRLTAANGNEALEKAKQMVKKPHYRIAEVQEASVIPQREVKK